jgi:hypothetical protein
MGIRYLLLVLGFLTKFSFVFLPLVVDANFALAICVDFAVEALAMIVDWGDVIYPILIYPRKRCSTYKTPGKTQYV